jgi:pimeloyl-ACP methyl ester carboxylesterase
VGDPANDCAVRIRTKNEELVVTATKRRGTLVLVHGAWHGSWCWEYLLPELDARGWATSAVDLPSVSGDPNLGMHDDARVVREHLETIDGPVTVLAHSYGGVPVTEVADTAPNVTRLVYLAAQMLEPGEAVVTPMGGPWFPPETTLLPAPEPVRDVFFHDAAVERAEAAANRLRPQAARAFTDELTHASWRGIPSAFISCDEDRILPELFVRRGVSMAAMVRHLPGSHCPFLSRPIALADVIDEVTQSDRSPLG